MRWYTITEYYDLETGDQLTKEKYKKEYITIRKTKKTEIHERETTNQYGIIRSYHECRKKPNQPRLW